jgi:hypothetical protein
LAGFELGDPFFPFAVAFFGNSKVLTLIGNPRSCFVRGSHPGASGNFHSVQDRQMPAPVSPVQKTNAGCNSRHSKLRLKIAGKAA